jgi:uncharacterized RDD family membrane protein YckC
VNKTNLMRAVAAAVVAFQLACVYVFPAGSVGAGTEWKDGVTTTWAASSPTALIWSALGFSLFTLLILVKPAGRVSGPPGWWRRALAFLIDFHFAVATLAGIGGGADLLAEGIRTGHFRWSFTRHYVVYGDLLLTPLIFIFMALLFLYFAFPLTLGTQTVGCFIMRTKVLPPFGSDGMSTWRAAIRRTWYEFRGVCRGGWFRPKRDADGNTWYDVETGCRVVLVEYTQSA